MPTTYLPARVHSLTRPPLTDPGRGLGHPSEVPPAYTKYVSTYIPTGTSVGSCLPSPPPFLTLNNRDLPEVLYLPIEIYVNEKSRLLHLMMMHVGSGRVHHIRGLK